MRKLSYRSIHIHVFRQLRDIHNIEHGYLKELNLHGFPDHVCGQRHPLCRLTGCHTSLYHRDPAVQHLYCFTLSYLRYAP